MANRRDPTHFLASDGEIVRGRSLIARLFRLVVILSCLGAAGTAAAVCVFLVHEGRTPREWAPYLQRRALRHRSLIVDAVDLAAWWLNHADRMVAAEPVALPAALGASVTRSMTQRPSGGHLRSVSSMQALAAAVASAQPGDIIEVQAGRYKLVGFSGMVFNQPGTAVAPITVRAVRLDDVLIEADTVQAFVVSAPFWRFENLSMRGVCADHSTCEHAIHVVGDGTDIIVRNNRFADFNAHLKINGERGQYPDRGKIEGNTFIDTTPRRTSNPVTPIDLVGASDWVIRGNVIADFARGEEGGATYGAFVKGAGERNVLERNLVICEWKLHDDQHPHVALSLGGGGTGAGLFRDGGRTGSEQIGGVIRDNLIIKCNDDGIYLNRAARSLIAHNTLIDTAGIDARFVETSATVDANIVDGAVRGRDGATMTATRNEAPFLLDLFAGLHPQRAYFRDPAVLDLAWHSIPDRLPDAGSDTDLCGRRGNGQVRPGAFDDIEQCLTAQ